MLDIFQSKNILVVEDEREIAELVSLHLRDFGVNVQVASDGNSGMELAFSQEWDLIILDIQLPGPSGLDICRKLRHSESKIPVMLLTSRSTEMDRVSGLEIGADDYMTKPFSIMELMARIKAIFRRIDLMTNKAKTQQPSRISIKSLEIDEGSRQVWMNDKTIDLTVKEFDLLLHFAKQPGRVFRRLELLDNIWGYGHEGYEHTVNSHINRLRSKIEVDPTNPEYVVTVWGVGYKMNQEVARI